MQSLKSIYDTVKEDFCNLLDYKLHGNTVEILTGIPTITQSMVSVFVSWDGQKFIASDGGWLNTDVYEVEENSDQDIVDRAVAQYSSYYEIKTTQNQHGVIYYYKTCKELKLVSSIVHDVGNFVAMFVNAQATKYSEPMSESAHQKQFQTKANKFLRDSYGQKNVLTNHIITLERNKRIKLNALVSYRNNQSITRFCLMYVTGNRTDVFIKDLTRATINFKIIEDASLPLLKYQRFAIVNTLAPGYNKYNTEVYLEELASFSDRKPLLLSEENSFNAMLNIIPSLQSQEEQNN